MQERPSPMGPHLSRVRERLRDARGPGPHDFVPGIAAEGDLRWWAEGLTRPLTPAHDLRLLAGPAESGEIGFFAEVLPWDTGFFGRRMARLQAVRVLGGDGERRPADLAPPLRACTAELAKRGVDYAFAIVDAREMDVCRALCASGWVPIESRLVFHRSLPDFAPGARHEVRIATGADVPSLSRAAVEMANPHDRFHADPAIPREDADRLMAEWVRASIEEGFADATLVPDAPSPTAFGTVRLLRDLWEPTGVRLGQFVFGAVAPEWKGWYAKLVSEACLWLRERGAEHVLMTTQAPNRAAVRTCEKLGFRVGRNDLVLRWAAAAGGNEARPPVPA